MKFLIFLALVSGAFFVGYSRGKSSAETKISKIAHDEATRLLQRLSRYCDQIEVQAEEITL